MPPIPAALTAGMGKKSNKFKKSPLTTDGTTQPAGKAVKQLSE
jgi:hypothetical protein